MKMNKILNGVLVSAMTLSMVSSVSASEIIINQNVDSSELSQNVNELLVDEKIGTIVKGDGFYIKTVSPEEYEQEISLERGIATGFPSTFFNGKATSIPFSITKDYPYAKIWVHNEGSENIILTVTKSSPSGTPMNDIIYNKTEIPCGPGHNLIYFEKTFFNFTTSYYANFSTSSGYVIGETACRLASTFGELG